MELLDLLPELLHIILFHASVGRAPKRALRLRLVCKTFAEAVYPALFETHSMDDNMWWFGDGTPLWKSRNQHGSESIWHEYLVSRVMGEQDSTLGRFVEMRQISRAILGEMESSESDLRAIVEELCWLALRHGGEDASENPEDPHWGPTKKTTPSNRANLGLNLLSVATHFDLLPLAKRLVSKGHSPTSHNYLFAPAIQIAAQTGNIPMLLFFQEQIPKSQFEPWSVTGAVIRDDMAVLKKALQLPVKTLPEAIDNNKTGDLDWVLIDQQTDMRTAVLSARKHASSPEVFEYLTSALTPWHTATEDAYVDLKRHALLGNVTMVRYLLRLGIPVQEKKQVNETPLLLACRGLHNEVVDLLLEHGADPNYWHSLPVYPLHESATAGSLTLTRKLLDHGANVNPGCLVIGKYPALFWAFAQEHTSVIKLLLERGASFNGIKGPNWIGKQLAQLAYCLGYDSMAKILREEYGFEMIFPLPDRFGHFSWQVRWPEAGLTRGKKVGNKRWLWLFD